MRWGKVSGSDLTRVLLLAVLLFVVMFLVASDDVTPVSFISPLPGSLPSLAPPIHSFFFKVR